MTLNVSKAVGTLGAGVTSSGYCLEVPFPFVTLLFEEDAGEDVTVESKGWKGWAKAAEARFGAVRDAVVALQEQPSSLDQIAPAEPAESEKSNFISFFDSEISRVRACWKKNGNLPQSWDGLSGFAAAGAAMTMPPTFPYKRWHPDFSGVDADRGVHSAFVDAFMEHEALRSAVREQADAWVQVATQSRYDAEDSMISKAQLEARRARILSRQAGAG